MACQNIACISLQECIQQLCDNSANTFYVKQRGKVWLSSIKKKQLKIKILNSLFNKSDILKNRNSSTTWQALSMFLPDVNLACSALQFSMILKQKKPDLAKYLNFLVQDVLSKGKDWYYSVIIVLICLSQEDNDSLIFLFPQMFLENAQKLSFGSNFLLKSQKNFILQNDLNEPKDLIANLESRFMIENSRQTISCFNRYDSSDLSLKSDLDNSHPLSVNVGKTRHYPVQLVKFDNSIFDFHSLHSSCFNNKTSNDHSSFFKDDEPYIGYRKPKYNLEVWKKHKSVKKNCTWETINRSNDTKMPLYVTEAGSKVYDSLWQFQNQLSTELAHVLVKPQDQLTDNMLDNHNLETDEIILLCHVNLVSVGIPSETFHFNKIANMFIPRKNIFFSGLTSSSVRALLLLFAEWGTAYWRLLQFSSCKEPGPYSRNAFSSQNKKGVIFQAFCDGLHDYLQSYFKNVLLHSDGIGSLLHRSVKFRLAGAQISYLCQFCQCGDPSKACPTMKWEDFPTDVKLISYIYEEAVFCTTSSDYMILLYFLQKCTVPYLEFIKNWMFYGICWELTSDFFLQINSNCFGRRDRLRWTNYVTSVNDEIENCVPLFLQNVSKSLFVCGKTTELLKLINPDHFLCTHLFTIPHLTLAFSKSYVQDLSDQWYQFNMNLREVELNRSLSWLEFARSGKNQSVEKSPELLFQLYDEKQAAEKSLKEKILVDCYDETSSVISFEMKKNKEKNPPHDMVNIDSEEPFSKKTNSEKIGDAEDFLSENANYEKELEILHNEVKNEMVSHYEALCKKSDMRLAKANWKKNRHMLDAKRTEFLKNAILSSLSETKVIKNLSFESSVNVHNNTLKNMTTHRKQVPGCDVSQSSVFSSIKVCEAEKSKNLLSEKLTKESTFDLDQVSGNFSADFKTQRKQVPGCNVSQSSVFSNDFNNSIQHKNLNASWLKKRSSLSDIFVAGNTLDDLKIKRKQVSGCNISQSTVFSKVQFDKTVKEKNLTVTKLSKQSGQDDIQHNNNASAVFNTQQKQFSRYGKVEVSNQDIDEALTSLKFAKQSDSMDTQHKSSFLSDSKIQQKKVSGYSVSHAAHYFKNKVDETVKHETQKSIECNSVIEKCQKCPNQSYPVSESSIQFGFSKTLPILDVVNMRYDNAIQPSKKKNHSSDSTIESLMYNMPSVHQLNDANPYDSFINKPSPSSPSGTDDARNGVYLRTTGSDDHDHCVLSSFFLKLPQVGTYTHHIALMLEKFSHKNCVKDLSHTIDLLSFYFDNSTNENLSWYIEDCDMASIDLHALPVLLRNCIILPIKQYSAFVNRCAINYFMMNLKLPVHFMTMRRFLLLEDGEFSSSLSRNLFDLMLSGCSPSEALKPIVIDSILSHALKSSAHHLSNYYNLSIKVKFLPLAFSTVDIKVFDCLQLYYHVDWPINIIVTESCHDKYNQVFSFLLKLKLVSWTLHDIRTRLNNIEAKRSSAATVLQIRKLQLFRHEMHNFVKVMQGYVSTQVLHVCWLEFYNDLLESIDELEDLHLRHAEYLNKCVMRCLLTKKAQNVMNVIYDILGAILRFRSQLSASFSFSLLHKTYREFARLSNFLYRVVSKLVQRGYQPHLQDFLTRLNFNGYYKLE